MQKSNKEIVFKEYYLSDNAPKYAQIADKLELKENEISKLMKELKFEKKDEIATISKLRNQYNNKKSNEKWGFKNFKSFYEWYKKQPGKCFYCGISEQESSDYYEYLKDIGYRALWERNGITMHSTRGKTLEVDRKDNRESYKASNCVLACYYCNNAKSDVFQWEEFKKAIGPAIAQVIRSRVNG